MNTENQKTILALDIGYGNTKAVWRQPKLGDSTWAEICFRSVAPRVIVDVGTSLASLDRVIVCIGQDRFYVGPKATLEGGMRELHPDYINTSTHEALLCGAWHYMFRQLGEVTKSVDLLVLGLPVSGFQANRRRLTELGKKVHRIPVPVELRARYGKDYEDVVAKNVLVLPQPMGAMHVASGQEQKFDLFEEGVISVVIDVGYNTLDWFVTEGMVPQFEACGSFAGGFSQILMAVSKKISFDHGLGAQNFGQIEKGLLAGYMNLGFKKIDMEEYKITARQIAENAVSDLLQQFDPQRAGVSKIFLAGGGAADYKDALQARLPDQSISLMDDPVMSNARGFYQAGLDYFND